MLRGCLALYQGRVYRLGRIEHDKINLVSADPGDLERGFTVYAPTVFVKTILRADIDEMFSLAWFGEYQGVRVEVVGEKEGLLHVEASQELPGFQRCDKFLWEGWVRPEELSRVWEQKTPL